MIIPLTLMMLSCVSLKIELPDEPDGIVDYISIVKEIDRDFDFSKRVKSDKISCTDSKVFAVIKVFGVSKKIYVKWRWFNPHKTLVKISKPIIVNQKNKYLEYFVAWDSMDNKYFKGKKGEWSVAVIINNRFVKGQSFSID